MPETRKALLFISASRIVIDSVQMQRFAGILGLAGATLFFVGDMLFNGHWGAGDRYASGMLAMVQNASLERLFAGGLVGPVAACLCMVGFWHVYQNVRVQSPRLGRIMLAASWVFWVAVGAVHLLWTPKALALKYCVSGQSDCANLQQAIKTFWALAADLASIPGYFVAAVLIYLVLLKKSSYPRWTVIANPAIWLSLFPFLPTARAPLGAILVGGSYNLPWVAFFLVSVLSTWRQRLELRSR